MSLTYHERELDILAVHVLANGDERHGSICHRESESKSDRAHGGKNVERQKSQSRERAEWFEGPLAFVDLACPPLHK